MLLSPKLYAKESSGVRCKISLSEIAAQLTVLKEDISASLVDGKLLTAHSFSHSREHNILFPLGMQQLRCFFR